jgi:cyclohexanone monooxygenase
MSAEGSPSRQADFDVVVVGAGFAGLYGVYKFRADGLKVIGVEAGPDVGGVWYFNRYPGARVDVESIDYSYSFSNELQQEWEWSEKFAAQPELLAYLRHVADRFDLRKHFRFNTKVAKAHRKEGLWCVETDRGERFTARFVVMAIGGLSEPRDPPFEGLQDFKGQWFMTARWPGKDPELSGKRVGMVGTGSSGLQCAPEVAKVAKHLYVFQRTPVFTIPARNGPQDKAMYDELRKRYPEYRDWTRNSRAATGVRGTGKPASAFTPEERQRLYEEQWERGGPGFTGVFSDLMVDQAVNDEAADFVRNKIRKIVKDPVTAEKLCPFDHPIGARRICIDTNYYDTYNRENVTLVDVKADPIVRITPNGIATRSKEYELDVIIFAIGFDAVIGPAAAIDIRNESGALLGDVWKERLETNFGLMTTGFPNMVFITGPLAPSVLANLVPGIEHDIDWTSDVIRYLDSHGLRQIDPKPEAQAAWTREVADVGNKTLFVKARSWYMGDNIAGRPRQLLAYAGGFDTFTRKVREDAQAGYEGFNLA